MEQNQEKLENRVLVSATCPVYQYSEYLVSATSTGAQGNDCFLTLYIFNNQSSKDPIKIITQIPISIKFTSIEWTSYGQETEEHALGIVIGGHPDGSISLWDITQILSNANDASQQTDYGCIYNKQLLSSSINVISINEKPHLFAVGSNQVSILSIDKNYNCSIAMNCDAPNEGGQFCSLDWNSNVNHILASATNTGMTYIYDMKKKRLFLSILDQSISNNLNTQIAWYSDGAQIIIAYDDNEYNYMLQYHMKQPNAPCAMYQNGHNNSIISISKNLFDKNFMLTLGRDNVVTCWNLKSKKPICKVPIKVNASQVMWCNKIKDCFIYVGFNQQLYYDRINFVDNTINEGQFMIPVWMYPTAGVNFAFGGKLFKFSKNENNIIHVSKLKGNLNLIEKIKNFFNKYEQNDLISILDEKINENIKDGKHTNMSFFWVCLKGIYINDEKLLFKEMGLDKEEIGNEVLSALGKKKKKENIPHTFTQTIEDDENVEQIFDEEPIQRKDSPINKIETEQPNTITENKVRNINWNVGNEKLVKKSLLIGDLESAVELLFKNERYSEALLVASMQPELFEKAKENYFKNNGDLFVKSFFPAIINRNFEMLFEYNLRDWKEYLLYAKTYLNQNDFQQFAEKLGDKLSTFPDIYPALTSYILSGKIDKLLDLLYSNYQKELDKEVDKNELLQNTYQYIILTYKILIGDSRGFSNLNANKVLYEYCLLLIREGLNLEAGKCLNSIRGNNNTQIEELYDRLYYNCEEELGRKFTKPNNPYNIIIIRPKNQNIKGKNQMVHNKLQNPINPQIVQPQNVNRNQLNPQNQFHRPQFQPQYPQNRNIQSNPPFNQNKPNVINKPPKIMHQNEHNKPFSNNPIQDQNKIQEENQMNNTNTQTQNTQNQPLFDFSGENKGQQRITKPPPIKPINQRRINNPPQPHFPQQNIQRTQNQNDIKNISNSGNISNVPHFGNNNIDKGNSFQNNPQFPNQNIQNEQEEIPMSNDEQNIYNYFENIVNVYNNVYPDENKRRDFESKIVVLLGKLKKHEIKHNLMKLLEEFIMLNDKNDIKSLRRIYMRIQSCDWDKNKSWMPLLERLINMKRN